MLVTDSPEVYSASIALASGMGLTHHSVACGLALSHVVIKLGSRLNCHHTIAMGGRGWREQTALFDKRLPS